MATIHEVEDFLALRRIAMVGVSRNPKDFSRLLFREMCDRGYDMVPINLVADEIDGRESFQCLQALKEPVEGVLVMTPFSETIRVVQDCASVGVRNVWLYRAGGKGAVSPEAIAFARRMACRWWMDTVHSCSSAGRSFRIESTACCTRSRDAIQRPLSEQKFGTHQSVKSSVRHNSAARLPYSNVVCDSATNSDEHRIPHFSSAFHKESQPSTDSAQS